MLEPRPCHLLISTALFRIDPTPSNIDLVAAYMVEPGRAQ